MSLKFEEELNSEIDQKESVIKNDLSENPECIKKLQQILMKYERELAYMVIAQDKINKNVVDERQLLKATWLAIKSKLRKSNKNHKRPEQDALNLILETMLGGI